MPVEKSEEPPLSLFLRDVKKLEPYLSGVEKQQIVDQCYCMADGCPCSNETKPFHTERTQALNPAPNSGSNGSDSITLDPTDVDESHMSQVQDEDLDISKEKETVSLSGTDGSSSSSSEPTFTSKTAKAKETTKTQGGLISDSFSLWLQSLKKYAKSLS